MAKIVVSDLRPAGADLFTDSESFLYDLTDDEQMIQGGGGFCIGWSFLKVWW
ncbi:MULTISPECIES: hypothetical protein [unclassified Microcystis]|uniref:hypothetical protein n=1 Tax=unclassified Microcystis TaxID=2643300 RepID=UPI002579F0D6|nr:MULTISPECIES: hypothetical protein [unclassified Microcystis]MCA2925835.1 hypothetical protein [Microcystis sp. M020S1]MCA2934739.1 hypothetical protein [Microcystis sp. M015S1]MCA2618789.1 hypothetical protein [Microcystis sp. M099S2]MCA2649704.1 hypothetical protein [Microcystis sp. M065S2]MCA2681779.1 hypothetical protein [Microcystis sp. M043S2]